MAEWFKKQRAGLDKLLSRPDVQKIYGLIGHDIVILPYGWGKQLLCKGKVEGVLQDGSDFDLGIGAWKTGKGPEACKRHSNIMGFNTDLM